MAEKDYLRIGKISSFNYPNGTARITYEDKDGSTTTEMPFLSWQYWMPKVGDQVLVAHLSTGTCAAVILGPVWHDGHRPHEGFEGLYRREYSNQRGLASERYDAKTKAYNQSVFPLPHNLQSLKQVRMVLPVPIPVPGIFKKIPYHAHIQRFSKMSWTRKETDFCPFVYKLF